MLRISHEPMTNEEANEIRQIRHCRTGWFDKIFRRYPQQDDQIRSGIVDVYDVTVDECFVYDPGNDFLVYFLDVGGAILILFGQWLFDPHIVIAPVDTFDSWWNSDREFFKQFTMRCWTDPQVVLKLTVDTALMIPAQPVSDRLKFNRLHEWELIPGHGPTLLQDLRNAGIADVLAM